VRLTAEIAGKRVELAFDTSKPQGVRGRNSDNARLAEVLGWTPTRSLREGLGETYAWIASMVGAPAVSGAGRTSSAAASASGFIRP